MKFMMPFFVTMLISFPAWADHLKWSDLVQRQELCPLECKMTETISFTSGTQLRLGQTMVVHKCSGDKLELVSFEGRTIYSVDPNATDIIDVANSIYAALTPQQQSLTLEDVIERPDLWPYKAMLLHDVRFSDARNKRGLELYVQNVTSAGVVLRQPNFSFFAEYEFRKSDFFIRSRENLESGTPGRLVEELQDKLINTATGQPFQLDPEVRYIMVYVGAQWCPWSRKFTPELIKFYNEVITENPEYEVVYIPGERSNSELMQYSREMNFPWPILRFDAKNKTAVLENIITRSSVPALGLADIYGVNILDMSEYSPGAVLNAVHDNIQGQE